MFVNVLQYKYESTLEKRKLWISIIKRKKVPVMSYVLIVHNMSSVILTVSCTACTSRPRDDCQESSALSLLGLGLVRSSGVAVGVSPGAPWRRWRGCWCGRRRAGKRCVARCRTLRRGSARSTSPCPARGPPRGLAAGRSGLGPQQTRGKY
jgi:hypothetical protein